MGTTLAPIPLKGQKCKPPIVEGLRKFCLKAQFLKR